MYNLSAQKPGGGGDLWLGDLCTMGVAKATPDPPQTLIISSLFLGHSIEPIFMEDITYMLQRA